MVFKTKKCTLSGCPLAGCLGLVSLLLASLLLVQVVVVEVSSGSADPDAAFYFHMRPRLGHFVNVEGYTKIYEEYFSNVIAKNDKTMENLDVNDWRTLRPTGEFCLDFLEGFRVRDYKVGKPYDIIPLDACLNWLFDASREKKIDYERFNVASREESAELEKDSYLKEIFKTTNFQGDKIPETLKEQLHNYFKRLLKINAENPRNGCHSLWLEAYNDFIEEVYLGNCESDEDCLYFAFLGSDKDSYLNLIVESTTQSSKNCYKVLQNQMPSLMLAAYEDESSTTKISQFTRKFKSVTNRVSRQSEAMKWTREMIGVLQTITGTDPEKPINLGKVVTFLSSLKDQDKKTIKKFTDTIAKYALKHVNMKDTTNDANGRVRFGKAMTNLCRPYIEPNNFLTRLGGSTLREEADKKPFEFFNLIYSLIRLTNHESIYGISKEQFEEDVLKKGWESLYLATFACQVISTTWGELDYTMNQGAYEVFLRRDAISYFADWPIQVLFERLAGQKESEEDFSEAPKRPMGRSGPSLSRLQSSAANHNADGDKSGKFKLKFKIPLNRQANQKSQAPETDAGAPEPTPAPAPVLRAERPERYEPPEAERAPPPAQGPKISPETLQLFRQLQADRKSAQAPSPSPVADGATRRASVAKDEPIPLAFDFGQAFETGTSRFAEPTSGSAGSGSGSSSANKWADLYAMSM